MAGGIDRRRFLAGGVRAAAALAVAGPLQALWLRSARAGGGQLTPSPYGQPRPVADGSTGLHLLRLPEDFTYHSFSWTGDPMTDGLPVPPSHDGMGVVHARRGFTLVRNHERFGAGADLSQGRLPPFSVYDPGAAGGCTRLRFRNGRWRKHELALAGTRGNCAGGATPWQSWLTCEETTDGPGFLGATRSHGWVFEVPARGFPRAEPLRALGRMRHEAAAVDPETGVVYLTEDQSSTSGVYRHLPASRPRRPGDLLRHGGALQMLKIAGVFQASLAGADFGEEFSVEWVDVPEPERAPQGFVSGPFAQGFDAGAARFARNEGATFGDGFLYFVSTTGGPAGNGQVFRYDPRTERLRVVFASAGSVFADNPDNLVASPRGGLLLCEDGQRLGLRLLGVTADGCVFELARNDIVLQGERGLFGDFRRQEWAGACFDPSGTWLFVNVQTPGITFAITGPWQRGPL